MDTHELRALMGQQVQVRLHHTEPGSTPFAEGQVVGFYDHPTIIVRAVDGTQSTHSAQLPIEVVTPGPTEPPNGTVLFYVADSGDYCVLVRDDEQADRKRSGIVAETDARWFATGSRNPYSWKAIAKLHEQVLVMVSSAEGLNAARAELVEMLRRRAHGELLRRGDARTQTQACFDVLNEVAEELEKVVVER